LSILENEFVCVEKRGSGNQKGNPRPRNLKCGRALTFKRISLGVDTPYKRFLRLAVETQDRKSTGEVGRTGPSG